jgi:mannosyltransferase
VVNLLLDNIIYSLQESGGISSYWYELLIRINNNNEFNVQYLENSKSHSNIFRKNLQIEKSKIFNCGDGMLSRALPVRLTGEKDLVFHSSYYRYTKSNKIKVVTTVHDFIQEKVNKSFFGLSSIMKKIAINNSDQIIVISENTKADLLDIFPNIDSNSVHVIYNGVSDCYYPISFINEMYDTVLFVGSRAGYKNFDLAVNVISKFDRLKLAIVGSSLTFNELKFLNSKLSVDRWTLYVNPSNSELNILYNQCALLVYPSSYEGFGIPIIEAMKAGCPVIALNSSSIPEVSGNAALLVYNSTVDEYYYGIRHILNNRDHFVKLGLANASRFSWDKTFKETVKIYKK